MQLVSFCQWFQYSLTAFGAAGCRQWALQRDWLQSCQLSGDWYVLSDRCSWVRRWQSRWPTFYCKSRKRWVWNSIGIVMISLLDNRKDFQTRSIFVRFLKILFILISSLSWSPDGKQEHVPVFANKFSWNGFTPSPVCNPLTFSMMRVKPRFHFSFTRIRVGWA